MTNIVDCSPLPTKSIYCSLYLCLRTGVSESKTFVARELARHRLRRIALVGVTRAALTAYAQRSRAARRPVVRVEDAFVGILAAESGVTPTNVAELIQDPPVGRVQDPSLFAGQMLVHRVSDFTKAFEWITFPVRSPALERAPRKRRSRSGASAVGPKTTRP